LRVLVRDDGVGLPASFNATGPDRLGLQIVNTLVAAELNGRVSFRADDDTGGAVAEVVVPMQRRPRGGQTVG
jgi:two-component system, sensor histidine kinase PdtaS